MKRILLIGMVVALSLTITGCSLQGLFGKKDKSQSSSGNEQKKVIAVALDEQEPNKALILSGIEDMAKKENIELKVISQGSAGGAQKGSSSAEKSTQGSDSGGSSKGESSKDSSSQLKGAKVLIYQGGNPQLLQSVEENQIQVIALNELPEGIKPAGIILPDPQETGKLMADSILNKVPEGQIVVMQGDSGTSTSQVQLAAIKQSLGKNPKLTVQVLASPDGTEAVAQKGLLEIIQKNPDKVKAVIAQNEKLASQAAQVLKSQQLEKKVLLVGGQANQQSLQRIASETQIADIDTSPYIQGVNAFQWAQKVAAKESLNIDESVTGDQGEVPAKIIPVKSVMADNLAVVQKSYAKAAEKAAAAPSQNQQNQGGQKDQKDQKDQKNSSNTGSDQDKKNSSQGQSGSQSSGGQVPGGATKVTEKIQTIITREYLDDKGKVLGTEKSSSEQNRTVPPEMLKQESQQKSQQGQEGQQKGQQGQQGSTGSAKSAK
ncbi:sugar ABC transporter substrate-binding protein [Desulfitobacterium sp.]|uniref:sugar ABC transporter substrate-binding protein n=1 Tax=Desulfitobacterium sp. TaxID=49981 RepID=UPI002B1EFF25|nr:substrate-binding domain-containing protein [Desulfitobacterium sp.]MEA4901000.1 substrate-binding domain-containing protein [Desulfitobacterium sp.]